MGSLSHKRILIIDDDEADRALLGAYLTHFKTKLFYANDGLEGIEQARRYQPDIILMDSQMPNCDGRKACKVITQDPRTRHIPVIFISALSSSDQRVTGLLAGAVDYINKPIDFNEVKLRLLIHLRNTNTSPSKIETNPERTTRSTSSLYSILFHTARSHLLKSLDSTPLMSDLEKLTGSNRKLLNEAFKKHAGMTVYENLREERMKEAKNLLQRTQLTVQDIAAQVGFSNAANFTTAFKERFGMSPRKFRQNTI